MTVGALAGVSALVAAGATIVVVVTLGLISSRGRSWARWNYVSSVVLMLATIPPALAVAVIQAGISTFAAGIALIGVVGMAGAATTEALLAVRRRTYEQLLPWTLAFGAVVGTWYLLVGLVGTGNLLRAASTPWRSDPASATSRSASAHGGVADVIQWPPWASCFQPSGRHSFSLASASSS